MNQSSVIAPFYSGDIEDQQMITASIGGSNLPQSIVTYAQEAEGQEGEVVAGGLVIDSSGSQSSNRAVMVSALNDYRKVITTSHERRKLHTRVVTFNHRVAPWEPFGPDAPFLTAIEGDANYIPEFSEAMYDPSGATALYRATAEAATAVDLFAEALEKSQGFDVRRVLAVVSDGFDNQSSASDLAQLRQFVQKRIAQEKWTFLFFGLIDPDMLADVANYVGISNPDHEFADRIFRAVAHGGNDTEIEKAIKSYDSSTKLGGMGFPEHMVMTFPNDPDAIRQAIGVQLSTTFIRASQGQINANVSLRSQVAAVPAATSSFI